MAEQPLIVVARIRAKADRVEQVKDALTELVGPTRQEPGCISYVLHQSNDDPALFLFIESWASRAALDEHLARPHLQAFIGRADELLAEPLDVALWHRVGE